MMINIHYKQTKRRYQPGGEPCIEGELEILGDSGMLCCEAAVPNLDKFEVCGQWKGALELAIKRAKEKILFFGYGGPGQGLSSSRRLCLKASQLAQELRSLLLESSAEYSESFEEYIVEHFPK